MGLFSRLIRFVFWVLIVTWVVKLLGKFLAGGSRQEPAPAARGAAAEEQGRSGKRLVRDPICGMHMAEELALAIDANGETQYFCSEECRAKYENSILHRAANA
jgi:YHS domain-containing protein